MRHSGADTPPERVFGTFGFYRYVLACMVIVTHMGPKPFARLGPYAVFAFYILSGYVVSFILHNTYLPLPDGLRKYALNRFLRIFPLYWIVLALSLILLIAFPQEAEQIYPLYRLPQDIRDWLWNITAVGMSDPLTGAFNPTGIVPVSWSLGIEVLYWILIPTFLVHARRRRNFVIFSLCYTLFGLGLCLHFHHFAQPLQFTNLLAASLPFCTGLLLFTRKLSHRHVLSQAWGMAAVLAFITLLMNAPYFYNDDYSLGFYSAFIINAVLVSWLSQIDRKRLPAALQRLDDRLGNLAYPMYLVHIPVGLLVHVWFPSLALHDWRIWGVTALCSSVFAWILYLAVERPINRIRRGIKH